MTLPKKLVFLGRLEDLAGGPSQDIAKAGPLPWNDLLATLAERHSQALVDAVQADKVRIAVNGVVIADKTALVLADGDEIAFLPPVSGG